MRRPQQLALPFPNTWGGKRAGAGRKRTLGGRPRVPHRAREPHRAAHPVHATMRARWGLPPFREQALFGAIRDAIHRANAGVERPTRRAARDEPGSFRVLHFSVQRDHLHLIVEAGKGSALSRGMQGLTVRIARAINRVLEAAGGVFADRFHARELRSPREVRNALVYVLMNFKKHERVPTRALDPFSSAPWFDGFRDATGPPADGEQPVVGARTWLAGDDAALWALRRGRCYTDPMPSAPLSIRAPRGGLRFSRHAMPNASRSGLSSSVKRALLAGTPT